MPVIVKRGVPSMTLSPALIILKWPSRAFIVKCQQMNIHGAAVNLTIQRRNAKEVCTNLLASNSHMILNDVPFSDQNQDVDEFGKLFCKTVPMNCIFPFTYKAITYQKCTNVNIGDDEQQPEQNHKIDTEQQVDNSDLWCATAVDANKNMVTWGLCNLETCEKAVATCDDDEPVCKSAFVTHM